MPCHQFIFYCFFYSKSTLLKSIFKTFLNKTFSLDNDLLSKLMESNKK